MENVTQQRADMELCLINKSAYRYICFYATHKSLGLHAKKAAAEGELLPQVDSEGYSMWYAHRRTERHLPHLLYGHGMLQASIDMVWLVAYRRVKEGM